MDNVSLDERDTDSETIPEMKDPSFTEYECHRLPPEDVISYSQLISCAELVRLHERRVLDIHPEFQRDFVWKEPDQTRFVDSLIKEFPIPSMCFAKDYKTNTWIVIDGLQRMSTIVKFLTKGTDRWRLSRLDDVDPEISGRTTDEIEARTGYLTRVENLNLPVNVLRCDLKKESHLEYVMMLFHRLNTSGMRLNNQEIRNCVFGGTLNVLLHELDQMEAWRRINKMKPGDNHRFVKQELILRFFAFHYRQEGVYSGRMAKFLDDFMGEYRNADEDTLEGMKNLFEEVVMLYSGILDDREPEERIPANILQPVMVGLARNIESVRKCESSDLRERYNRLKQSDEFADKAGLAGVEVVEKRLRTAKTIFSDDS